MLRLYSYFRSSAAYRVRIALNLKGLAYDTIPVHLVRGEQRAPAYLRLNPAGLVPSLDDDGAALTQSMAIMEYLEERHPTPPLLPGDAADRARIRSMAQLIACEIHPLNNLRVLKYLTDALEVSEDAKSTWYRHWTETGLGALEELLAAGPRGSFCHGATPTLADCCLVPQLFNARRFGCRLDHVPTLLRIYDSCMELEAFRMAAPENQRDAA